MEKLLEHAFLPFSQPSPVAADPGSQQGGAGGTYSRPAMVARGGDIFDKFTI
jgi:hypothetical protein